MIRYPWALSSLQVLERSGSNPEKGLTQAKARQRLKQYGANCLRKIKKKSVWVILLNQFKNVIILILAGASILSFVLGEWLEGIAIGVAIAIFVVIGFFTELKAVRSIEALRVLGSVRTKVLRGGEIVTIKAQNLVPGDIGIFGGGDVVTADFRLIGFWRFGIVDYFQQLNLHLLRHVLNLVEEDRSPPGGIEKVVQIPAILVKL